MAEALRHAIVTGAAGDIGQAITRALATAGWRLGLIDLDERRISGVPTGSVALSADVTDANSVDAALVRFGAVPNLVVNNAGIVRFGPLLDHPLSEFETVLRVNLLGAFIVARSGSGDGCSQARWHDHQYHVDQWHRARAE